jgi:hypothetical protein
VADFLQEVSKKKAVVFGAFVTIWSSIGYKKSLVCYHNKWIHCRWHQGKIKSSTGHVKISLTSLSPSTNLLRHFNQSAWDEGS